MKEIDGNKAQASTMRMSLNVGKAGKLVQFQLLS